MTDTVVYVMVCSLLMFSQLMAGYGWLVIGRDMVETPQRYVLYALSFASFVIAIMCAVRIVEAVW